jgi:hypothetical protein
MKFKRISEQNYERRILTEDDATGKWIRLQNDGLFNSKLASKIKRFINLITGLDRPLGFQEFEAPRFLDNRHMKVVRLSALRTGRLFFSYGSTALYGPGPPRFV